jgi:hypothetical protein
MPHAEAEEQIDGADGDCRGVGVAGDSPAAVNAARLDGHRTAAPRGKPTAGPHPLRPCPGTIASTTAASSCRLCLCHGFSCLAAAGGRLLRPGDAQAGSVVPAEPPHYCSLRHRPVPRSPERSSGLDRPRDRNPRRAMPASWSRSPLLCHGGSRESARLLRRKSSRGKVPATASRRSGRQAPLLQPW